ncbi:hypothetical protein AUK40_00620 [Candidatus Wirthbacteria bacterium CG2_30_54_11]|uniref:ABC transporter domain-containing protein n=1 Tax=Candidatus Wirthbacteria bacterium CG2_30_54_11 TaxID=1817892 RepID=A0A1J5IZ09_9BACT|nr:MAG: hypothetical protein AUK40_00620 [Candidatus Wirthbacteria bacterium CG2_30_54_11]
MLSLTNVRKTFGRVVAVDQISLEVAPGEIFGFLGPNGAGKTTTIKMIAGLLSPTAGQVTIDGHDVHREPVAAKQALSYIPDEPYLYDKLTGRECLELVATLHHIPVKTARQRIEEMVTLFNISEFIDQYAEGFSHGTRQKFVFAAAFLPRPRLLLIDEPMVGLDPQNAHLVKTLLRQIATEDKVCILLSTHTLSLAQDICDRIGIIYQGRLSACGTLDELRAQATSSGSDLEELYLKLTGGYGGERIDW